MIFQKGKDVTYRKMSDSGLARRIASFIHFISQPFFLGDFQVATPTPLEREREREKERIARENFSARR